MSPLLNDSLVMTLMPDRVGVVRLRGLVRARLVDQEVRPSAVRCGADNWDSLLDVCETLLSEPRWHGSRVRVVVSNHLIRYAWLQWMDGLQNEAEEEALVRHRLGDIYGAATAAAVEARWDHEGEYRVACAMPRHALERLQSMVRIRRGRLTSVQPMLMTVFNAFRKRMKMDATTWFAVAEPGFLCLGSIDGQTWRSLRCVRTKDVSAELSMLVARERILTSQDQARPQGDVESVFLWSPRPWPAASTESGLRVVPLVGRAVTGWDPDRDADQAAAMLGAVS